MDVKNATVTETVTAPNSNGLQVLGQPQTLTAQADLRSEYVPSGQNGLYGTGYGYGGYASFYGVGGNGFAVLPRSFDELTTFQRDDIYAQMGKDDAVSAALNYIKLSAVSQDWRLSNAIPEKIRNRQTGKNEPHPDFEEGQKWLELVERNLSCINLVELSLALLDCVSEGSKVAEVTYKVGNPSAGEDALSVESIKPKSRQAVAFVVDAFGNIAGFLGYGPGRYNPYGGFSASLVGNDVEVLPREKFIHVAHRPQNGDPRGTSILPPAYDPWWQKRQAGLVHEDYLVLHASPKVTATTGEGAVSRWENGKEVTPEQQLAQTLIKGTTRTATALPFGSVVSLIQAQGNGEAFTNALDYYDRRITRSILGTTQATGDAKNGTRSTAEAHQDVTENVITYCRTLIENALRGDLFVVLLRLNGCLNPWKFAPYLRASDTQSADRADLITAVSDAKNAGLLVPSQMPEIDAQLGFPIREAGEGMDDNQNQNDDPTDKNADPNAKPDPYANEADETNNADNAK